jgi:hypothetical protein
MTHDMLNKLPLAQQRIDEYVIPRPAPEHRPSNNLVISGNLV